VLNSGVILLSIQLIFSERNPLQFPCCTALYAEYGYNSAAMSSDYYVK
jgi:hypothetical protein